MISKATLSLLAAAMLVLGGCYVESEGYHHRRGGTSTVPTPSATDPTSPAPSANPTSPLLIEVDTDQTLNVVPGDGVGVFVEYRQGGGWHLTWTCDTKKSNKACNFEIAVTAASAISGAKMEGVDAQALVVKDTGLHMTTATGASLHGVTFQTTAGAVITVEAKVDGISDGAFLFFVQDGKVNGDFKGKLTNPAQFVGKKA